MKIFIFLVCLFHLPYLIILLFFSDIFSYQLMDTWYSISLVGIFVISSLAVTYFLNLDLVNAGHDKLIIKYDANIIYFSLSLIIFILIIVSNIQKSYILFTAGYLGTYIESESALNSATLLPFYVYFSFRFFLIINFNIKSIHLSNFSRVIFVISLISFLLTGSRSLIVYFFLAIYYYLARTKLNFKILNIKLVLIFALLIFTIGIMRENGSESGFDSLMIRPIIETHHTAKTLIDVVAYPDLINESLFRYVQSLGYLLPSSLMNIVGFELPKLLASIYVDKIDPGWAAVGGGFGFSILSELYISVGVVGFFIFPMLIGIIFVNINKLIRKMEINAAAYSMSLCYYIFSLARGEIVDTYRGILVVSLLYFIGRFRFFKNH